MAQASAMVPAQASVAASYPSLYAEIRTSKNYGSSKVRRLRDTGRIPGVIYGQDEDQNVFKIMVSVDEKHILTEMRERGRSLESTIYQLQVHDAAPVPGEEAPAGSTSSGRVTTHLVTPRQLQMNPITDRPLSINFVKYWPGTRVRIPVEFINMDQSVDLRRGSFLIRVNRFVECVCGMEIPKSLVLDLTGAAKGDVLRLSSLIFPPGVKPSRHVPADFVIGVIRSARGS